MTEDFAARLEALAKAVGGLSNRAMARLLGVTDPTIIGWRGGQRPLDSKIRGMAARTGLSEVWLQTGKGDEEEQLEIFRRFVHAAPTPRDRLLRLIDLTGKTHYEVAKEIGYDSGKFEKAISTGQASERMIEAVSRLVPNADKHDLMAGSDEPTVLAEDGLTGSYGSKPRVNLPGYHFMVPLLSFAQAGQYALGSMDDHWAGESVLAMDIKDRRAFGLRIEGESMCPHINPGDVVIAVPSMELRKGDTVIVKTTDGQVFCKLWAGEKADGVHLLSHNPAHPDLIFPRDQVAFIYPVAQVTTKLRR